MLYYVYSIRLLSDWFTVVAMYLHFEFQTYVGDLGLCSRFLRTRLGRDIGFRPFIVPCSLRIRWCPGPFQIDPPVEINVDSFLPSSYTTIRWNSLDFEYALPCERG